MYQTQREAMQKMKGQFWCETRSQNDLVILIPLRGGDGDGDDNDDDDYYYYYYYRYIAVIIVVIVHSSVICSLQLQHIMSMQISFNIYVN
jgi:hypothetical protein